MLHSDKLLICKTKWFRSFNDQGSVSVTVSKYYDFVYLFIFYLYFSSMIVIILFLCIFELTLKVNWNMTGTSQNLLNAMIFLTRVNVYMLCIVDVCKDLMTSLISNFSELLLDHSCFHLWGTFCLLFSGQIFCHQLQQ